MKINGFDDIPLVAARLLDRSDGLRAHMVHRAITLALIYAVCRLLIWSMRFRVFSLDSVDISAYR